MASPTHATSPDGGDANGDGELDECECVADIAGPDGPGIPDGIVGTDDLLAVIGYWGSSQPNGDANGDGIVGTDDLLADDRCLGAVRVTAPPYSRGCCSLGVDVMAGKLHLSTVRWSSLRLPVRREGLMRAYLQLLSCATLAVGWNIIRCNHQRAGGLHHDSSRGGCR